MICECCEKSAEPRMDWTGNLACVVPGAPLRIVTLAGFRAHMLCLPCVRAIDDAVYSSDDQRLFVDYDAAMIEIDALRSSQDVAAASLTDTSTSEGYRKMMAVDTAMREVIQRRMEAQENLYAALMEAWKKRRASLGLSVE